MLASSYGMGFILDGITSVGGIDVCPEAWNAEAVVVGAQKCTAGPSGIAAIAINDGYISESNHRREKQLLHPAYYFDLQFALKKEMMTKRLGLHPLSQPKDGQLHSKYSKMRD